MVNLARKNIELSPQQVYPLPNGNLREEDRTDYDTDSIPLA